MQTTDTHSDILVLTAPLTVTRLPMHAPAVLKAIAKKAGFSCRTVDLNQLTYRWSKKHTLLSSYFRFDNRANSPELQKSLDTWLSKVQKIIAKHQPKILAVSVFSWQSRIAAKLICQLARHHFPTIKIIIGGSGISVKEMLPRPNSVPPLPPPRPVGGAVVFFDGRRGMDAGVVPAAALAPLGRLNIDSACCVDTGRFDDGFCAINCSKVGRPFTLYVPKSPVRRKLSVASGIASAAMMPFTNPAIEL